MRINLLFNREKRIVGYQEFPLNEEEYVYELEDMPRNFLNGSYGIDENGKVILLDVPPMIINYLEKELDK